METEIAEKPQSTLEQIWGEGSDKYILDVDSVPSPDWLVEGVIVRQGLTLLYGDTQMGKTTLCLYLIDALQNGVPFFGRTSKHGKVLIVEQDQSPSMLKSQKDKLGIPKKLWTVKIPLRWNNTDMKFNAELEEILSTCQPDVVIVDAYTSLGIADINHPSAGLTFDELRLLGEKYNCAFLLIHHTGKSGTQMGSALNIAKMDSVLAIINSGRMVESTFIKQIIIKQEKLKADNCEDIEIDFNTEDLSMKLVDNIDCKKKVNKYIVSGKTLDEILKLLPQEKPNTVKRYYRDSTKKVE